MKLVITPKTNEEVLLEVLKYLRDIPHEEFMKLLEEQKDLDPDLDKIFEESFKDILS